jgi:predicted O-methyltransferase YrrM
MSTLILGQHPAAPGMQIVDKAYDAFRSWYDVEITLSSAPRLFGHLTTSDCSVFTSILAKRSKGPIIEFGTFTGRNARDMAMNTDQPVYTIDITSSEGYPAYEAGIEFLNEEMVNKPRLLLGDSRIVAIPVEPRTAGFIFIDGGHQYDVVKSDSERAFELIRPDGVILWDDYSGTWHGVCEYLDELSKSVPLLHIRQQGWVAWGLTPLVK